jgi:hypothetical protein
VGRPVGRGRALVGRPVGRGRSRSRATLGRATLGRATLGRATLQRVWAPLLAAGVVGLGLLLGWRGVDVPAQLYRVNAFRAHGLAIWDSQWFGGHWTLSYSMLYPPLAGLLGPAVVTLASAALAALGFERLAVAYLGRGATPAAFVFAIGTVVQSAIGQWPFLTGEALAVCACWAATRHRWAAAAFLALGATLMSPLAGVFVALALAAWALAGSSLTTRLPSLASPHLLGSAGIIVVAVAPIGVAAVLFPGQGRMPYPPLDYGWEMAVAAVLWLVAGRDQRVVRCGVLIFALAATASVLVPSPLGGNVGRIEDVLAVPLLVGLLWSRQPDGWRWLLPLTAVPLVLSQWGPAWAALTTDTSQPATHAAYFAPLVSTLTATERSAPAGRVEVVPTRYHWEADYVAAAMPLARGWERQLDETYNPLFYDPGPSLTATAYRDWLLANGVRYVALSDAPLDFAGTAEARLVATGVPGLTLVWRSTHWRLYQVDGSSGIVAAPAHLLSDDGDRIVISAPTAGSVLVRVRYSPDWELAAGRGCVAAAPTGAGNHLTESWIRVQVPVAERFTLRLDLWPSHPACTTSP